MDINLIKRLSDEEHDKREIKKLLGFRKEYEEIKNLSREERAERLQKFMRGEK